MRWVGIPSVFRRPSMIWAFVIPEATYATRHLFCSILNLPHPRILVILSPGKIEIIWNA